MTASIREEEDQELTNVRRMRTVWTQEWTAKESTPLGQLVIGLHNGELSKALEPAPDEFRKVALTFELPTHPEDLRGPLAMLMTLAWGADILDRTMESIVRECRRRGRSWSHIADALRVTRQSAWSKFAALDEEVQTDN